MAVNFCVEERYQDVYCQALRFSLIKSTCLDVPEFSLLEMICTLH